VLPLPTGNGCILFVDDEEALVQISTAMLERLGYDVVARTSSLEALEAFEAAPHRFDLVITDQTMPHMTGEVLISSVRLLRPDIPVILCTGFSHVMHAEKARGLGVDAFLMKPVTIYDLACTVQQVLIAAGPVASLSSLTHHNGLESAKHLGI
jgi:CheY-like chemotaxis protein